jgi:hypothetical protein
LSSEETFNVVATPFAPPPVGNMRFHSMPTVSSAAIRNYADSLISELISTDVIVEVSFITSNDDEPT